MCLTVMWQRLAVSCFSSQMNMDYVCSIKFKVSEEKDGPPSDPLPGVMIHIAVAKPVTIQLLLSQN